MLTIKQSIDNAYVIATVMRKCKLFKTAVSSINNICDLNVTEDDLRALTRLRVNYPNYDKLFYIYE